MRIRMGADTDQDNPDEEIQRFAADPRHPHFWEWREYMAKLVEDGLASTLEEAYFLAARYHQNHPSMVAPLAISCTPDTQRGPFGNFGHRLGIVFAAIPIIFGIAVQFGDAGGTGSIVGAAICAAIFYAIPAALGWALDGFNS